MQPNPQEQLFRTGAAFRLADALQHQREHHVFEGCQPRNQLKTLKHEPDFLTAHLRQFVRRQGRNVPPVQTIYPGGRAIKAAENVHQRRFPRPARPDHRGILPRRNAQRNVGQHGQRRRFSLLRGESAGDAAQVNHANVPPWGQKAPVRVECPDRGEFILFPNSIMRGKGIPRLRSRELVRRDASLPATKGAYLSAFGIAGGTSGSWGVAPSPSRDAVPAPCKGQPKRDEVPP